MFMSCVSLPEVSPRIQHSITELVSALFVALSFDGHRVALKLQIRHLNSVTVKAVGPAQCERGGVAAARPERLV
jgi:hypothetical protein